MFSNLAIIAVVAVVISAAPVENDAACPLPNGTEEKFYWKDCSTDSEYFGICFIIRKVKLE